MSQVPEQLDDSDFVEEGRVAENNKELDKKIKEKKKTAQLRKILLDHTPSLESSYLYIIQVTGLNGAPNIPYRTVHNQTLSPVQKKGYLLKLGFSNRYMGPINRVIEQAVKFGGRARLIGLMKNAMLDDEKTMLTEMFNRTRDKEIGAVLAGKLTDENLNQNSEWYVYNSENVRNAMRGMAKAAVTSTSDLKRGGKGSTNEREFWFVDYPTRMDIKNHNMWFEAKNRQKSYDLFLRDPLVYSIANVTRQSKEFTKNASRGTTKYGIQAGYYIRLQDEDSEGEVQGFLHFTKIKWDLDADGMDKMEEEDKVVENKLFKPNDQPLIDGMREHEAVGKVIRRQFTGQEDTWYRGVIAKRVEISLKSILSGVDIENLDYRELQRYAKLFDDIQANKSSKHLINKLTERRDQEEDDWDDDDDTLFRYTVNYADGHTEELSWGELSKNAIKKGSSWKDWLDSDSSTIAQTGQGGKMFEFLFFKAAWDHQGNKSLIRTDANDTMYKVKLSKWGQDLGNGGFKLYAPLLDFKNSGQYPFTGYDFLGVREPSDIWEKVSTYLKFPKRNLEQMNKEFSGTIRGICPHCGHAVFNSQPKYKGNQYWHAGCYRVSQGIPLETVIQVRAYAKKLADKSAEEEKKAQKELKDNPAKRSRTGWGSEFNLSFSRLHIRS